MKLAKPHYKLNMSDIFKPLTIGRQRFKPKPEKPKTLNINFPGRQRKKLRKTTPKPDSDHNSVNEDNNNGDVIDEDRQVTTPKVISEERITPEPNSVGEGEAGELEGDSDMDDGDYDGDHGHGEGEEEEEDHDHNTDHEGFTCEPASSQHSAYIRDNLDLLQKKCHEFQACTEELYRAENFHRILSGGNIQLSNMCGLMYANGGGKYTTLNEQCSSTERDAIRQDIGDSLAGSVADPPPGKSRATWRRLKRCLDHNAKDREQPIDTACRLKKGSTFLCEDHDVDQVTEKFFNHELEHLHCSCKAITAEAANANGGSRLPVPARIGIACGVFGLLLILVVVVIVLCYRHRKVKRKLDKHRMQYLPSPHSEPSAIYQEIGHGVAMDALRRAKDQGKLPMDYNLMEQAPALPDRYVKDLSGSRPNLAPTATTTTTTTTTTQGDSEYLEPLPDPNTGSVRSESHTNDAYNASQGSQHSGNSVYHLAKHPAPSPPTARAGAGTTGNPTYNQLSRIEDADGGYSSLGRKYAPGKGKPAGTGGGGGGGGNAAKEGNEEEREPLNKAAEAEDGGAPSVDEPKYFLLEPQSKAA